MTPDSSCHVISMSNICTRHLMEKRKRYNDYRGPADGYLTWPKHVAGIIIATLNLCMVRLQFVHYEFYTE